MWRRRASRSSGLPSALAAVAALVGRPALAFVADSPVLQAAGSWGAPCLIDVPGDGYYSFATINSLANVPIAYSADFADWSLVNDSQGQPLDAMPYLPTWVEANNPGIWGPDVNLLDNGTFLMYFSGMKTNGQHCLGYAYSSDITGPYIPNNDTWFCPAAPDQAIDPDGFHDPVTGLRYVTFKWNKESAVSGRTKGQALPGCGNQAPPYPPTPIMLQQVAQDGVTKIGNMTVLVDNDGAADCGNTESPSMMRDAAGAYVLYFSTGFFLNYTYTVSYAVSTSSVYGPYARAAEPLFSTGVYNMRGPGTADVLNNGTYMVLFAQTLDQESNPNRKMRSATVGVAANDTVLGNGTTPSGTTTAPSSTPTGKSAASSVEPSHFGVLLAAAFALCISTLVTLAS